MLSPPLSMCHSPWAGAAPGTASRPAYSCRSALFGSDRLIGLMYGTFAARCSTCCPPRAPGSACSSREPSATPKSRPSVKCKKIYQLISRSIENSKGRCISLKSKSWPWIMMTSKIHSFSNNAYCD